MRTEELSLVKVSPCQTEEPGGGEETFSLEAELGQDKLGTVENKPENKMK